jgi:hypothetical protein
MSTLKLILVAVAAAWPLVGCENRSGGETSAPPAAGPVAAPEPAAAAEVPERVVPGEPGTPPPNPGEAPAGAPEELTDGSFIGLSIEQGQALAERHHLPARVVKLDGEEMMVTQDYRPERLNFTVENGVITKVTRG